MTLADKRMEFMEYVRDTYKPQFVYYPACGADYLPKKVFGETSVIHLSLPENERDVHYLERLGNGIKILGDMRSSPLADMSIDLIWVCTGGIEIDKTTLGDFLRVLKSNGLIAIEVSQYVDGSRDKWQKMLDCFVGLDRVSIPERFDNPEKVIAVSETDDVNYRYTGVVVKENEMMDMVSENKGKYVGREYMMDYALFRKR